MYHYSFCEISFSTIFNICSLQHFSIQIEFNELDCNRPAAKCPMFPLGPIGCPCVCGSSSFCSNRPFICQFFAPIWSILPRSVPILFAVPLVLPIFFYAHTKFQISISRSYVFFRYSNIVGNFQTKIYVDVSSGNSIPYPHCE